MHVTVEFYGILRQAAGHERITLEPAGNTVSSLLEQLVRDYPALTPHLPRTACAVGSELVTREYRLRDGGCLALIPPVSGGCA